MSIAEQLQPDGVQPLALASCWVPGASAVIGSLLQDSLLQAHQYGMPPERAIANVINGLSAHFYRLGYAAAQAGQPLSAVLPGQLLADVVDDIVIPDDVSTLED